MSDRDALLAAVRRRAAQLRRRRAAVVAGPAVLVLAVAAGGLWLAQGGSDHGRLAVSATTTSTHAVTTFTASTTSTTTIAAPTTTTVAVTPTGPPATQPVATTTTTRPTATTVTAATAPPPCHDSYDPACGPFQWSPPPGANRGMSVTLAVSDLAPHAGDAVSITVDASDPDAMPACGGARIGTTAIALTDSVGHGVPGCPVACPGPARYGPWAPPAPGGGSRRWFGTFTASGNGAQQLTVSVDSGSGCAYLAYGSAASTSATVTVQ